MKSWLFAVALIACNKKAEPTTAASGSSLPRSAVASGGPTKYEVQPPTVIKDIGLATPESVLYDADADVYLVSNING